MPRSSEAGAQGQLGLHPPGIALEEMHLPVFQGVTCMLAEELSGVGWSGVQGSGCWSPRTDAHKIFPKKSSQCLGHQLPIPLSPLNPTSSTPSCIPGDKNPEPRAGGPIHPH